MADLQQKLEEYRLRKRRTQKIAEFKGKIKQFLMLGTGIGSEEQQKRDSHIVDVEDENSSDKRKLLATEESDDNSCLSEAEDLVLSTDDDNAVSETRADVSPEQQEENKVFKYTLRTVYFLFWVTLYVIAIELKFGIVFLMFSALLGIYFNTRTGPKKRHEISAYSVFNKNCESIDGTLKAEQFEREMRYGAGSVR